MTRTLSHLLIEKDCLVDSRLTIFTFVLSIGAGLRINFCDENEQRPERATCVFYWVTSVDSASPMELIHSSLSPHVRQRFSSEDKGNIL